jgi:hypothetical protein
VLQYRREPRVAWCVGGRGQRSEDVARGVDVVLLRGGVGLVAAELEQGAGGEPKSVSGNTRRWLVDRLSTVSRPI